MAAAILARVCDVKGGNVYLVWNDNWPGDTFEVVSDEIFRSIEEFIAMLNKSNLFNIELIEVEE